jgi:tellurite resistance protein TerC
MQFHWVVWLFGTFLIVTGHQDGDDLGGLHRSRPQSSPEAAAPVVAVTADFLGSRFLVAEGGGWVATPLLVALVCLEVTDIVFALDSVPAIFALTGSPSSYSPPTYSRSSASRSLYSCSATAIERFPCCATVWP